MLSFTEVNYLVCEAIKNPKASRFLFQISENLKKEICSRIFNVNASISTDDCLKKTNKRDWHIALSNEEKEKKKADALFEDTKGQEILAQAVEELEKSGISITRKDKPTNAIMDEGVPEKEVEIEKENNTKKYIYIGLGVLAFYLLFVKK